MYEYIQTKAYLKANTQKDRVKELWFLLKVPLPGPEEPEPPASHRLGDNPKGWGTTRTAGQRCRNQVCCTIRLGASHGHAQHQERCPHPDSVAVHLLVGRLLHALRLPSVAGGVASTATRKFCLMYGALSTEARQAGHDEAWVIKPKMHMLQEMVEYQTQHGNPRMFWTYPDEDFV
eukprot:13934239-Alexandrium_andersonii.AAC.1